jgi:hypothetical protein
LVIKLSMFKIQLENGEFYKSSKGNRVQHYVSEEKATAKIAKLGEIASGAKVVECSTKTKNSKVVVVKTEKSKKAKKSKKSASHDKSEVA